MTETEVALSPKARADRRIIAPLKSELSRAARLSVLAGLIWPLQAAIIAWTVGGWVTEGATLPTILLAAGAFAVLAIARAVLDHRAGKLLFEAAETTIARERAALMGREARARSAAKSAEVAALVAQKLPLLQPWITRYYVAMARTRVLPLVLLALAFSISWAVGLVLLIAGPLIPVFMALVGLAAEDASKKQMDEIGSLNALTMERVSAMLDIRLLGATDRVLEDFSHRATALREQTMQVLRIAFLSSTVLELFSALGVALVAVFVGFTLLGEIPFGSWSGTLSLSQGLFLLLIAPDYFQPMRDLAVAWHDRAAGFAVVAELEAQDDAPRTSFLGVGKEAEALGGPATILTHRAVVELPGTTVQLPDLDVQAGSMLALSGPSGVGKSTALSALMGLIPLSQGEVRVAGQLLNESTADAWRARVAFVPQRPHFSDAPISRWLDPRGTGADPWPALEAAQVAPVVRGFPDGLETVLGEAGGGVSGGEARRLMLARAMIMGGDVLFADEPTADLDEETAAEVTRALLDLNAAGRTIIVATHDRRLATAMGRDVELAS